MIKGPPQHTLRFNKFSRDDLREHEVVFAAEHPIEERGKNSTWAEVQAHSPQSTVLLKDASRDAVSASTVWGTKDVPLTDSAALAELTASNRVLVDISGLPHHVWAPLFKSFIQAKKSVRVLYVEPDTYRTHPTPASSNLFDLSASFDGLAPLPGFAKLNGPPDSQPSLFIAFLGFEGNRAERILNQLEPPPRVIPAVGAPGFQINYPAITVACNRVFLDEFRCHSDIKLVRASCPFAAYEMLAELRKDFPDHYFYIAPVGTRPHALGSIFYAMNNDDHCEILFDHPVRQPNRTSGRGLIHVFHFPENG